MVQRVLSARVTVNGETAGEIGPGLLVYVGIGREDGDDAATRLARKVAGLRIFNDAAGKMNLGLADVGGSVLAVPNFTLHARTDSRRPSFGDAAPAETARALFEAFVAALGVPAATGRFGADMRVTSEADGPVNLIVEA